MKMSATANPVKIPMYMNEKIYEYVRGKVIAYVVCMRMSVLGLTSTEVMMYDM
jgi:uncharacterized membrane protein